MTASDAEPATGLRERRRRATLTEISNVALDLFETHGVAATTVDEIARIAGVSPRTFFRYFATKEHALLVDDEFAERAFEEAFDAIEAGAAPVTALDEAWMHVVRAFDDDETARARFLRVRRVIEKEPTLLALVLQRDSERNMATSERLMEASGGALDRFGALAILEFFGSAARLSFNGWAHLAGAETVISITEIYERARTELLRTAAALP